MVQLGHYPSDPKLLNISWSDFHGYLWALGLTSVFYHKTVFFKEQSTPAVSPVLHYESIRVVVAF